jgi:hypothetical protein
MLPRALSLFCMNFPQAPVSIRSLVVRINRQPSPGSRGAAIKNVSKGGWTGYPAQLTLEHVLSSAEGKVLILVFDENSASPFRDKSLAMNSLEIPILRGSR